MCLSGVHPLKSTLAASYNEFKITIEFGKHQHTVNLDIRVSFLEFVQKVVNSIAMCMCPHIYVSSKYLTVNLDIRVLFLEFV